jgi:polyhydroxyalkanoate synthesis repressor PhaR
METERIIKKYPNRRLYDTAVSAYISLEDLRLLVKQGCKFKVIDAKSEEDITRSVLFQIILEQEEQGRPIFNTQMLEQLIRTYGDATQDFMTTYLEQSMAVFLQQQEMVRRQMTSLLESGPLSAFDAIAQQNQKLWQSFQDSLLHGVGAKTGQEGKGS